MYWMQLREDPITCWNCASAVFCISALLPLSFADLEVKTPSAHNPCSFDAKRRPMVARASVGKSMLSLTKASEG